MRPALRGVRLMMQNWRLLRAAACFAWIGVAAAIWAPRAFAISAEPDEDLIKMVVELLGDADKELRAVGLEQVRLEIKGSAATVRFAEQLPKLPPEARIGLLSALGERGDSAARPMVLAMLGSGDESTVVAATTALGAIGTAADAGALVRLLHQDSKAIASAARASLVRFGGEDGPASIVAELKRTPALVRVSLIDILAARRAKSSVPELLGQALVDPADLDGGEPGAIAVRAAAMKALGELADPEHLPGMIEGVVKAGRGGQRDAAERAVAAVCGRITDADRRGETLLAAVGQKPAAEQPFLLPLLGRVGGSAALRVVEAAIASSAPLEHDLGLKALGNWPDASVAPRLIELASSDPHPEHRAQSLAALIRVAPLPDKRPPAEKLALLERAMTMCSRDDERSQVLRRVRAVRIVESLRYLMAYLDRPEFAEVVCESIVELAHHRELREPNKAEFHAALDRVKATSNDAVVVDRATRYQNNQTWTRPAAKAE